MLCAYPTVKYVQIQDARLVCLRYSLLLVIAFYVGFFEMFAMGGWLEPSPVVGVVRFSLQQPTVDNCDPVQPGCDNAFSPLDSMPYCEQFYHNNSNSIYTPPNNYAGKVFPCEIYESVNAQIVNEKSLTVMTRASTLQQRFVCPANDINRTSCPKTYENTQPEYKFYIHQSESFTVMLDHAVTASKICSTHQSLGEKKPSYACSAESAAYQGRLYSKNDHLCKQEHLKKNAFASHQSDTETDGAPCYINPNKTQSSHQDFFSLDVLLQAAGVSLDDCNPNGISATDNNETTCQTYRDSGATLLLNVFWSDFVPYRGMVEPHYYYSLQLVGRSSYKMYIPYYSNYRDNRTLLNAHGIRLAVLLGGEFNQFSVVTFLVTLTTALGLLAVATTVVDSLMLYILPEKERYQEAKYENTERFEANDVVSSAVRAGLGQLRDVVGNDLSVPVTQRSSNTGADAADSAMRSDESDGLNDPLLPSGGTS